MNKHLAQTNMIKQQLRTGNVINNTILDLYQNIDRATFVPEAYQAVAYSDLQIPLNHEQKMLTPLEEALIMQALALNGREIVLEIGTGTGFLSALLSRRCKQLFSVDYFPDLTAQAQKNCAAYHCNNINFITGDGCHGWVDHAPYDVIVFTGCIETLTETHKLQTLLGGKIFAIMGKNPIMEGILHQVDHQGQWTQRLIFETNTPPLIDNQPHQPFIF